MGGEKDGSPSNQNMNTPTIVNSTKKKNKSLADRVIQTIEHIYTAADPLWKPPQWTKATQREHTLKASRVLQNITANGLLHVETAHTM